MSDEADPSVTGMSASIGASADVSATPTVEPFRVRLIEAGEAAFARLEAKSGPGNNIFAETGEVLFWLYAMSNFGVKHPTIAPSFRWARDNYGHGILLHELHYTDGGTLHGVYVRKDDKLVADFSGASPPGPPVHCWVVVKVARPGQREEHPERLAAYNRYLAGQPVIATLRAEFDRIVLGGPLPANDFEGMTAKDFSDERP